MRFRDEPERLHHLAQRRIGSTIIFTIIYQSLRGCVSGGLLPSCVSGLREGLAADTAAGVFECTGFRRRRRPPPPPPLSSAELNVVQASAFRVLSLMYMICH